MQTSKYIRNYGIVNQIALIDIAWISAKRSGTETSGYIQNYGITDQNKKGGPCPKKHENFLNKLVDDRAKDLGLELFTLNQRDNLSNRECFLESLGSCFPYEYADSCSDVIRRGIFTIPMAKAVILR